MGSQPTFGDIPGFLSCQNLNFQTTIPSEIIAKSVLRSKLNRRVLSSSNIPLLTQDKEEDLTKSAMAAFRAKEDEIERKKTQMSGKIEAQLGCVEEEAKRLAGIHAVSLQIYH
ncbi:hypothetical protein STAS_31137 [Striga asiatica]|uniref:RAB6-interacting golgin n=1 Tax=Striga asiatica TaxID=4170 RepID=A0A5A7R792_STRAF|nr:hypothetical protein STAS_31137 [Striga asiatica]